MSTLLSEAAGCVSLGLLVLSIVSFYLGCIPGRKLYGKPFVTWTTDHLWLTVAATISVFGFWNSVSYMLQIPHPATPGLVPASYAWIFCTLILLLLGGLVASYFIRPAEPNEAPTESFTMKRSWN